MGCVVFSFTTTYFILLPIFMYYVFLFTDDCKTS